MVAGAAAAEAAADKAEAAEDATAVPAWLMLTTWPLGARRDSTWAACGCGCCWTMTCCPFAATMT